MSVLALTKNVRIQFNTNVKLSNDPSQVKSSRVVSTWGMLVYSALEDHTAAQALSQTRDAHLSSRCCCSTLSNRIDSFIFPQRVSFSL